MSLTIINFAILIIVLCFGASLVWEWKSKESLPSMVTKMVLAAVLLALEILRLVIEISIGEEYAFTIFLIVLWALNVLLSAFLIVKKMTKKNPTVSVDTKILKCINRDENECEQKD